MYVYEKSISKLVIVIKRKRIWTISIAVAFLFISSAMIVPQVNSKPVMDKIDYIESKRASVDTLDHFLLGNIQFNGIFEWLVQLIKTIIQLVFKLIEVVQNIINLVQLIENLINALQILFQLIQQLVELIQDIIPKTGTFSLEINPEIIQH